MSMSMAGAGHVPHARKERPWWLWPHLLSLDAPLVALVWQGWWSHASGLPLFAAQRVILGLGVWLIYLADRLLDISRARPGDFATARHEFAGDRRRPLAVLAALIGAVLALFALCALPPGQFRGGLVLLAATGGYFWLIHRHGSQGWKLKLPKEAVVGGMFAVGTAFFTLCEASTPAGQLIVAVALFGTLCFLNCALITSWERNGCDRRDPFSLLNVFPRLAAYGLQAGCWVLSSATAFMGLCMHTSIVLPVTIGAFSLGILDLCRHRLSAAALRSLADAVLLAPWICGGILAVIQ